MKIRKLKLENIQQCIILRHRLWAKLLIKCYPEKIAKKYMNNKISIKLNKDKKGWIIESSKNNATEIIGFIFIRFKGANADIVHNFITTRGKGLGKKLYKHAEEWIKTNKPEINMISVNSVHYKPSIKFYESIGFSQSRIIIHNKNPEDITILMEKII